MSDPYSAEYTDEELQNLPQTQNVFDRPKLVINDHQWVQKGYMIEDVCSPSTAGCHPGGIPIPSGSLLIKDEKGYRLVDEVTRR